MLRVLLLSFCAVVLTLKIKSRIMDGIEADIKRVPYQLNLIDSRGPICGAVLIKRNIALTAAHCVQDDDLENYLVAGGSSYLDEGSTREIKEIIVHPLYNPDEMADDLAILKLSKRFRSSEKIYPIRVTKGIEPQVGKMGLVSGWGETEFTFQSYDLMAVEEPIISREDCQKMYKKVLISKKMLCAGYSNNIRGSCAGDSGGPLVVNNILYGIVSWGDKNCLKPTVYTNLAQYWNFIASNAGFKKS